MIFVILFITFLIILAGILYYSLNYPFDTAVLIDTDDTSTLDTSTLDTSTLDTSTLDTSTLDCANSGLEIARTYYNTFWEGEEIMDPIGGINASKNECDIKYRVLRKTMDPKYDYRKFRYINENDSWKVYSMGQRGSGYLAKNL